MNTDPRSDRLDDLLILSATQVLTPAEELELSQLLLAAHPDDPDATARAAAAIHLALSGPPEPLPAHVAAKLHRAAAAHAPASPAPPRTRPAYLAWAGWAVAACLAGVLASTYWPKPKEPTLAQKRDELRKDAPVFAAAKDGMSGEVVWSNEKQEGYIEVRGLPPLDPAKWQYQLWIVDPSRKQPVDGGVFDVRPDGTALVRVRAPIHVKEAKAFAVTKEDAGGVVVSDGPMLLVLAPKS